MFGRNIGDLKGETTRSIGEALRDASVEMPKELLSINKEMSLSMDRLTINGLKFLTNISNDVCYREDSLLPSAQYEDAIEKFNKIIDVCKKEN